MKIMKSQVTLKRIDGDELDVADSARVSFDKESDWGPDGALTEKDAKLIRYLAKNGHWTPLAHVGAQFRIKTSVFVARQLVKHCVTGDTEVTFCKPVRGRSNGRIRRTIGDLYRMWSGQVKFQGGAKGRRNVAGGHVKVFDEKTRTFASSHIVDVLHQGVKPVLRIVTESGQSLRVTADHQVLTQRGWVAAGALLPRQDSVVTEEIAGELLESMNQRRDLDSADVVARRSHTKSCCAQCGATERLECDHIVPVSAGGVHDAGNLQTLCTACHKAKSSTEKSVGRSNAFAPRLTEVLSIDPAGEEDVYDITVEGTHNFLANGLVVHNCVGLVWNEVSRRYVSTQPEYLQMKWRWAADNVKQGSGGEMDEEASRRVDEIFWPAVDHCDRVYAEMLDLGVAPEQARAVLNLNHMTEWIWTGSLVAWARICKQRLDSHAQSEASDIASPIDRELRVAFPNAWPALMGEV